jgi:hypothetical protein
MEQAIAASENVRERYHAVWRELHLEPQLPAGDRHAIRGQLRRLNDLGFAVDEIEVSPSAGGSEVRLRVATTNRAFHAIELERLTGIRALEGQARLLLNDMHEHMAWLRLRSGRNTPEAVGARRWRRHVLDPALRLLKPVVGDRDLIQAYSDVLEHKWLLSERAGHDVGLKAAIDAYLAEGAPAPEVPTPALPVAGEVTTSLDA